MIILCHIRRPAILIRLGEKNIKGNDLVVAHKKNLATIALH